MFRVWFKIFVLCSYIPKVCGENKQGIEDFWLITKYKEIEGRWEQGIRFEANNKSL